MIFKFKTKEEAAAAAKKAGRDSDDMFVADTGSGVRLTFTGVSPRPMLGKTPSPDQDGAIDPDEAPTTPEPVPSAEDAVVAEAELRPSEPPPSDDDDVVDDDEVDVRPPFGRSLTELDD